jgi:hypothetical protein
MLDCSCLISREFEPSGLAITVNQVLQTRLVDRYLAAVQTLNAPRVDVDAEDVIARVSQGGARHQPHVAEAGIL